MGFMRKCGLILLFMVLFSAVAFSATIPFSCEEKKGCNLTDDYINANMLLMGTLDNNRLSSTVCQTYKMGTYTNYKFTNLNFAGTTGFADLTDDVGQGMSSTQFDSNFFVADKNTSEDGNRNAFQANKFFGDGSALTGISVVDLNKVKASATDTTANYLDSKIFDARPIYTYLANAGGNEYIIFTLLHSLNLTIDGSGQLDTIQNIKTTSSVKFHDLNITDLNVANISPIKINSTDYNLITVLAGKDGNLILEFVRSFNDTYFSTYPYGNGLAYLRSYSPDRKVYGMWYVDSAYNLNLNVDGAVDTEKLGNIIASRNFYANTSDLNLGSPSKLWNILFATDVNAVADVNARNMQLTALKTCTVKTNASGAFYCGTDNTGGGGGSGFSQAAFDQNFFAADHNVSADANRNAISAVKFFGDGSALTGVIAAGVSFNQAQFDQNFFLADKNKVEDGNRQTFQIIRLLGGSADFNGTIRSTGTAGVANAGISTTIGLGIGSKNLTSGLSYIDGNNNSNSSVLYGFYGSVNTSNSVVTGTRNILNLIFGGVQNHIFSTSGGTNIDGGQQKGLYTNVQDYSDVNYNVSYDNLIVGTDALALRGTGTDKSKGWSILTIMGARGIAQDYSSHSKTTAIEEFNDNLNQLSNWTLSNSVTYKNCAAGGKVWVDLVHGDYWGEGSHYYVILYSNSARTADYVVNYGYIDLLGIGTVTFNDPHGYGYSCFNGGTVDLVYLLDDTDIFLQNTAQSFDATTMYGGYFSNFSLGAGTTHPTIANSYGLYVATQSQYGVDYGIYLTQANSSTHSFQWGFYAPDQKFPHYLKSTLLVGDTNETIDDSNFNAANAGNIYASDSIAAERNIFADGNAYIKGKVYTSGADLAELFYSKAMFNATTKKMITENLTRDIINPDFNRDAKRIYDTCLAQKGFYQGLCEAGISDACVLADVNCPIYLVSEIIQEKFKNSYVDFVLNDRYVKEFSVGDTVCHDTNGWIKKCSDQNYALNVIGIITSSDTASIITRNENVAKFAYPVALAGVAKANVICPITENDLIVSTTNNGKAMRMDWDATAGLIGTTGNTKLALQQTYSPFAVALEGCTKGEAQILVKLK